MKTKEALKALKNIAIMKHYGKKVLKCSGRKLTYREARHALKHVDKWAAAYEQLVIMQLCEADEQYYELANLLREAQAQA